MSGVPQWREYTLGELLGFSNGVNAGKAAYGSGTPFINVFEVVTRESLTISDIPGRVTLPKNVAARYAVRRGDVLFNRTSETLEEVGLSSVYLDDVPVVFGGFVFRGRPLSDQLDHQFSRYAFRAGEVRAQITARGQGGIRANIGQRDLKSVVVRLPDKDEQVRIAAVLDDVSALIDGLVTLIAKKRDMLTATKQCLLTGRARLEGFVEPWRRVTMEAVLAPRVERHGSEEALEVLSCTKHHGFVRSLDFFRNQVFSRNLAGYRVIRRGDIGYPANHVEEGSIGVQELFDAALVSPIYVVMRPVGDVDTYFIQRQLKLESFRQEFSRITNASVNRRGSLRWPEFSKIEVDLPEPREQRAISRVLRDLEAELEALGKRLAKARALKTGMSQRLVTGRTRLAAEVEA